VSKIKRAYKYRFYPAAEQKHILAQTFGCCRFVYNWGLSTRKTASFQHGQKLTYNDLSALLPALKKEYPWLCDVSSVPVQQSLRHLDRAYKNFFEGRAKYPMFKKRRNTQSATYASNAFTWEDGQLTLAKMDQPLALTFHRAFPKGCKPSSVTVSKDCADRYFVSMLVEEEIKPLPPTSTQVGLDLGLKSMVILSTGEAVGNPRYYAKDEKRLAKAQRRHAKKKKGSKNREKARRKIARVHARINDRRRDYQHKLSARIVHENQVMCVESLAVKNMVKTTVWPNRSMTWDGVNSFVNWNTRACGMDEPSSKLIVGIRRAKRAMTASMWLKTSHLMCVNGSAQSVVSGTTAISTLQKTFWPRGSRCLPVEEVSDLLGRKLELATPNEAGKFIREDEAPDFSHGEMSPLLGSACELCCADCNGSRLCFSHSSPRTAPITVKGYQDTQSNKSNEHEAS
jgi:putative transposase